MASSPPRSATRVAVGIVRGDPPQVFVADSDETLGRVLALHVVAQSDPEELHSAGVLEDVRQALLEERWGDAVAGWIDASGEPIDGYPDEIVWTPEVVEAEQTSMEIRLAPIFGET